MAGLGSLSSSLSSKLGERKARVCLMELGDDDKPLGEALAFQYFPESVSDTKQVNYQTKEIPGASLPLYQWISSGERALSFTATFTSDVDLLQSSSTFSNLTRTGLVRRNIDPRTAVAWLRRFMLPRYDGASQLGTPLTKSPRKAILYIPNSGLGLAGGVVGTENGGKDDAVQFGTKISEDFVTSSIPADAGQRITETTSVSVFNPQAFTSPAMDRVPVIMLQCDVTYQAFFPSGMPRLVEVSLSFAQIAQVGGTITFPADSEALKKVVDKGAGELTGGGVFPYPFKAKVG